jgi:hypothetical protein
MADVYKQLQARSLKFWTDIDMSSVLWRLICIGASVGLSLRCVGDTTLKIAGLILSAF